MISIHCVHVEVREASSSILIVDYGVFCLSTDEIDLKLDKDRDHYGYHSSRRQTFLKVLETISDLLQDDFMSAVTALTMCTEQLTERLSKFCSSECPKYRKTRNKKELKDGIKLYGSLAAGFTPRMSR